MSKKYRNKRVQMWDDVANFLKAGGSMPDDPDLRAELSIPTYSFNKLTGVMDLMDKDTQKKEYGASPDCGDAVALTIALTVVPKERRRSQEVARTDYDVLKSRDPEAQRAPIAVTEYALFGGRN